jgi:hypothetical protein
MPLASDQPLTDFDRLLKRLPPDLDLEALSRETKAFQRPRGVRSGTDLLRLMLGWACGHSLQYVAAWAGEHGIASLTDEALVQRFHRAVPFLEALTQRLLGRIDTVPCWHQRVLRVADSTSLSRPGSKGTDWRLHSVFDLALGRFTALQLTDAHGGEGLDRGEPVKGEIRIADRGYANAQAWQRFRDAGGEGADFIVRMRWSSIRMSGPSGEAFDFIDWLQRLPPSATGAGEIHEVAVRAHPGKHAPPIPIRLIARRKSPAAMAAEHKRLYRHASRKQRAIDPKSLVAAEWVVMATTLPTEGYPAHEVMAVYRLRWQIELAFKRLKSLLKLDQLRATTERGTRCWLYGLLVVALLSEDLTQELLESFPSGH